MVQIRKSLLNWLMIVEVDFSIQLLSMLKTHAPASPKIQIDLNPPALILQLSYMPTVSASLTAPCVAFTRKALGLSAASFTVVSRKSRLRSSSPERYYGVCNAMVVPFCILGTLETCICASMSYRLLLSSVSSASEHVGVNITLYLR